MRRVWVFFVVFLIACQGLVPEVLPVVPRLSATATSEPAQTARPAPSLAPTPSLPVSPPPTPETFSVIFHPDGSLYVGDLVSLEVIAAAGKEWEGKTVHVQTTVQPITDLGEAKFEPYGIGARLQATLMWAWDTRGLEPGDYTLTFSIQPDGPDWLEPVRLYPAEQVPLPEPYARWEVAESECCVLHYITGTAGARDLPELLEQAGQQAEQAIQRIEAEFGEPIVVTILPRVLGHGGFAGEEIYVSYLDRNYVSNDFSRVMHHEMIHILDGQLGGELRPSLLVEGLAVYLTGGHFKPEPLLARAAALLDSGWYLPLAPLADDFYTSQHEIGYLEAGALVEYLVQSWGWERFNNFYRDIHPDPSGKESLAMDKALQAHFGLSLAQLEAQFLSALRRQRVIPDMEADLRLTVEYFETVRRYQQTLDPSAYFLTAWLPDGDEMRQRGIVADYLRHPMAPENVFLETLFGEAYADLLAGNYTAVDHTLWVVNSTMDELTPEKEE